MTRPIMALAAALACAALAQTPAGSILGTVTDASDAIVPGVTVVVTNVLTGVRHATKTNQEGEYLVPYLIPGDYQVTAEASGFKTFQRGGLTLQVDQRLRIDVVLSVGDTKETIVVEARAPLQLCLDRGANKRGYSNLGGALAGALPRVVLNATRWFAVARRGSSHRG